MSDKPTLGLIPKYLWLEKIKEERYQELKNVMSLRLQNDQILPQEWITEYNESIKEGSDRKEQLLSAQIQSGTSYSFRENSESLTIFEQEIIDEINKERKNQGIVVNLKMNNILQKAAYDYLRINHKRFIASPNGYFNNDSHNQLCKYTIQGNDPVQIVKILLTSIARHTLLSSSVECTDYGIFSVAKGDHSSDWVVTIIQNAELPF